MGPPRARSALRLIGWILDAEVSTTTMHEESALRQQPEAQCHPERWFFGPFHRAQGDNICLSAYLNACTTGSFAARRAGKNPPISPITTAKQSPANSSAGLTRKLKAISLKLAQLVVLVTIPLIGNASSAPITPPTIAISADSARK